MKKINIFTTVLLLFVIFVNNASTNQQEMSVDEFLKPTSSNQLHTWWHWMQGSISKEGITKDLESMKKQGISQATILNVGLLTDKIYLVPQIKFDTKAWYEMFAWALQEADRLGIKIGAHNCDGWSSSGGPWITPAQSMKTFTWSKTQIEGATKSSKLLKKPFARENYYQDVMVVAIPSSTTLSNFQKNNPQFKLNDSVALNGLADGSSTGGPVLKWGDKLSIKLDKPIKVNRLAIVSQKPFSWSDPAKTKVGYNLYYSMDGINYQLAKDARLEGINRISESTFEEVEGKYFRMEFSEFPWADSWFPYMLAEVELLNTGEIPLSNTKLNNYLEKSVTVKAQDKSIFNTSNTNKTGITENNIIDVTSYMLADGTLNWNAPKGKWDIIRFGYTTTATKNSPATAEGEGLECDKMDSNVVNYHFSQFPQKLINAAGIYTGNTFKFLLIDSWECGFQNWTQSMPAEFEKRRGYKLSKFLPVLCGEIVTDESTSEAFLYDFRKTIGDLIEDNYYKQFSKLCYQNKLEMHAEIIYGGGTYPPLDVLKTSQYADMPMFEFWTGTNSKTTLLEYNASKNTPLDFPVSATLFYDKKVLGAEAYTAMAHYSESPWELKPYGDRAFCSGINQLILHSYVHQPADSTPGMTLGNYGSPFNRNNNWFNFSSSWMDYQSRIQFMLRQGQMHADVLYYAGDQLPQFLEPGTSINVPNGYQIHVANYDVLKNKLTMKAGKLTFGNVVFSLLTLPENMGMELATLQRLEELVKEGLVIYGPKPRKLLSMNGIKNNNLQFKELIDKLWGKADGAATTENVYGKGKVIWGITMKQALDKVNLKADFETINSDTNTFLYTHRVLENKDLYFVVNQQDRENNRAVYFRTVNTSVKVYNPKDGSITPISFTKTEDGRSKINFTFGPRESRIFMFEKGDGTPVNTVVAKPQVVKIADINGTLSFDTRGHGKVDPVSVTELKSLTDYAKTDIKYFSGYANYELNFSTPPSCLNSKNAVWIDFGKIGITANVTLNGINLGTIWYENAQFEVSKILKAKNTLQITVANEARNRIIGDYVEYGKLKNIWSTATLQEFLNKDSPLKVSGFVGPVTLIKK